MGCQHSSRSKYQIAPDVPPSTGQPPAVPTKLAASEAASDAARKKLMKLEKCFDKLSAECRKLPPGPKASHQLAKVIRSVPDVAPMRVTSLNTLRAAVASGTVHTLSYHTSTLDVGDIDPAVDAKFLLISHRWWSSTKAQPDRIDVSWPKVQFVCAKLVSHFCRDAGIDEDQVFIWWDFLSINQVNDEMKVRQIESLPVFVAMSDALCALRAGDDNYHAPGGPIHPKTLQPFEGSIDVHPGHYNNRVWTALELFCATSPFVRDFAGGDRRVYCVDLDRDFRPTGDIVERGAELRTRLHETYDWTLPPRANLDHSEDLAILEPLAVILRSRAMPQTVTAAMCELTIALKLYLDAGYDVNAKANGSGATALHCAARRADTEMISLLAGTAGVDVNAVDKIGNTPLHELARAPFSRMRGQQQYDGQVMKTIDGATTLDFRACVDEPTYERARVAVAVLLKAGADPTKANNVGRCALEVHADFSDDVSCFVGYEKEMKCFVEEARRPKSIVLLYPLEKLTAACAESGIAHTAHERAFENGNLISWEEMRPASGEVRGVIVILNGGSMSVMILRDFAFHLCVSSGFRICMFDNPGAGKSRIREGGIAHISDEITGPSPRFMRTGATSEVLMDYLLKDLEIVIKGVVSESHMAALPVHATGISLGALHITRFVIKHPEWFTSLTVFGMVHGMPPNEATKQQFEQFGGAIMAMPVDDLRAMTSGFMSGFLHPSATDQMLEMGVEAMVDGDIETRLNFLPMLMLGRYTNVLEYEKISCPTLFVTGEADTVYMEHAELVMQKLSKSAGYVTMPRVGHTPCSENPQLSSSIMLDFVMHLERD